MSSSWREAIDDEQRSRVIPQISPDLKVENDKVPNGKSTSWQSRCVKPAQKPDSPEDCLP